MRNPKNHKVLSTIREVEDLSKARGTLTKNIAMPMQQIDWISACLSNFYSDNDVKIVVYGTPEQPLAVAPLVHSSNGNSGRLELAGVKELFEPSDLIWSDIDALENLAAGLTSLKTSLILDRLPAESPSIDALKKAFHGRGVVVSREGDAYPFIQLDESWKEPETHLSPQRRSDLMRAVRRAEMIGQLKTVILSPKPGELEQSLNLAFKVEANSWKGRVKTALSEDIRLGNFYRSYVYKASREGILRLCFLYIGERAAAMQIAVECQNRFWLLKIGYDEQFARCSAGNILLRETIKYAAEKGVSSFEFLGKVEPWTLAWTGKERKFVSLRVYPFTSQGMKSLGIDLGRSLYKKFQLFAKGGE